MKKLKKLIQMVIVFVLLCSSVSFFSYAAPKIGLALGEGGSRFYIHIGVLKALTNEGIKLDYIAGTSIGSFIGGLYALWEDIDKIEKYALSLDFDKYYLSPREDIRLQNIDETPFVIFYSDISKGKIDVELLKGLMDGKIMRDEIDRLTNWASFEYDLKIPFKVVTTDLITGEKVVISEGRISNAIAASMSVPGLSIPFKFEDRMLVDGGLIDPVPVDVVREMGADIVIGVNLRDIQEDTLPVINNVVSILYRSIFIMLGELNNISANKADIVIKPHYRGPLSSDMEKEKKLQLIKLGEEETKKIIPLLKTLINS
ncbi:MAG: patatin-like phospholipase family protein [Atribacterota bacterium]|nr:patatin-like phospholipase family protein [Atribacterota bacterium]